MIHPNPPSKKNSSGLFSSSPQGLEGALTSLKGQVATVEHKMQDLSIFVVASFWDIFFAGMRDPGGPEPTIQKVGESENVMN